MNPRTRSNGVGRLQRTLKIVVRSILSARKEVRGEVWEMQKAKDQNQTSQRQSSGCPRSGKTVSRWNSRQSSKNQRSKRWTSSQSDSVISTQTTGVWVRTKRHHKRCPQTRTKARCFARRELQTHVNRSLYRLQVKQAPRNPNRVPWEVAWWSQDQMTYDNSWSRPVNEWEHGTVIDHLCSCLTWFSAWIWIIPQCSLIRQPETGRRGESKVLQVLQNDSRNRWGPVLDLSKERWQRGLPIHWVGSEAGDLS